MGAVLGRIDMIRVENGIGVVQILEGSEGRRVIGLGPRWMRHVVVRGQTLHESTGGGLVMDEVLGVHDLARMVHLPLLGAACTPFLELG